MHCHILAIFAGLASFSLAWSSPLNARDGVVCEGQVVQSERFIGKDRNVKLEVLSCPNLKPALAKREVLETRQTALNLCGIECNVNCFPPAGGGPDPNQCHVIADALRFESQMQEEGPFVTIGNNMAPNNTISLTYLSCQSFFVNQDPLSASVVFCRTQWADTLDNLAFNCQATQNAHGGNCVATDQSYFIQVDTN